jgi:carbon-monoxide dehydrogenase small subunit
MVIEKLRVDINVNGRDYVRHVEPRYLLADFLRHELGLKGTHVGCEQGVCGACTVMIDGRTARSCLHFAVDVAGTRITTVEGLGNEVALDPVQQAFHDHHALQCGFCTPGFLMTAHELLKHNPDPTEPEIRAALTNNICRCTGYTNIISAVAAAAARLKKRSGANGESE